LEIKPKIKLPTQIPRNFNPSPLRNLGRPLKGRRKFSGKGPKIPLYSSNNGNGKLINFLVGQSGTRRF